MAIKDYKPTTPARRGMSSQDFDAITTKKPLKSLYRHQKTELAGRNNQGRITTRHRGGGARQLLPPGQLQTAARHIGDSRAHRIRS